MIKLNFLRQVVIVFFLTAWFKSFRVAALGYQGISYTTREKVVDIGPLTMTVLDK